MPGDRGGKRFTIRFRPAETCPESPRRLYRPSRKEGDSVRQNHLLGIEPLAPDEIILDLADTYVDLNRGPESTRRR